jgi:uncharacterized protein YqgV (UPF0045/DUF77 family)
MNFNENIGIDPRLIYNPHPTQHQGNDPGVGPFSQPPHEFTTTQDQRDNVEPFSQPPHEFTTPNPTQHQRDDPDVGPFSQPPHEFTTPINTNPTHNDPGAGPVLEHHAHEAMSPLEYFFLIPQLDAPAADPVAEGSRNPAVLPPAPAPEPLALPVPFPQRPMEVSISNQTWPFTAKLPVVSGDLGTHLVAVIPKVHLDFTLTDGEIESLGLIEGAITWPDVKELATDILEISVLEGGLVISPDQRNTMAAQYVSDAIGILKNRFKRYGLDFEVGPATTGTFIHMTYSNLLTQVAEIERDDFKKTIDVMPSVVKHVSPIQNIQKTY